MSETKTQTNASAPKRRRADAERSIAAIVNGALEALASDPDASMAEIARRAGVVRATIYMHFPTREALLDAVMENATGAGRRRDPRSRARTRRAGGSARAGAPRNVETAQPVPRVLGINIDRLSAKELRRRHLPITIAVHPSSRARPGAGRLQERCLRRLADRRRARDRLVRFSTSFTTTTRSVACSSMSCASGGGGGRRQSAASPVARTVRRL